MGAALSPAGSLPPRSWSLDTCGPREIPSRYPTPERVINRPMPSADVRKAASVGTNGCLATERHIRLPLAEPLRRDLSQHVSPEPRTDASAIVRSEQYRDK
jgi:hypothetical protein